MPALSRIPRYTVALVMAAAFLPAAHRADGSRPWDPARREVAGPAPPTAMAVPAMSVAYRRFRKYPR